VHYIIVGTDHPLQESNAEDTRLRSLLRSIVDYSVVLIAEEVPTSRDVHTFGCELIGESKWLSIDMTIPERKDAGLDDIPCEEGPGYDPVTHRDIRVNRYHTKRESVREQFWLDKIARWCEDRQLSAGTVVVTCGYNHMHAEFLSDKLRQRGHTVSTHECMNYDIDTLGVFTICP
jgi:hypothetical protein